MWRLKMKPKAQKYQVPTNFLFLDVWITMVPTVIRYHGHQTFGSLFGVKLESSSWTKKINKATVIREMLFKLFQVSHCSFERVLREPTYRQICNFKSICFPDPWWKWCLIRLICRSSICFSIGWQKQLINRVNWWVSTGIPIWIPSTGPCASASWGATSRMAWRPGRQMCRDIPYCQKKNSKW